MDTKYIFYQEPVPGMERDGKSVTCSQKIVVSKADAVRIQRRTVFDKAPRFAMSMTDDQLLGDFVVVNWAEEEP